MWTHFNLECPSLLPKPNFSVRQRHKRSDSQISISNKLGTRKAQLKHINMTIGKVEGALLIIGFLLYLTVW